MAVIYLDNAATSWPKPPEVISAMERCMKEDAANPGRGAHAMAVRASRILFEGRKQIAKLCGIHNPNDISYASNTSEALNLAIKGYVKPGDHVICTSIEHNSVRRPLEYLRQNSGIQITYVAADQNGEVDLKELEQSIRPNTSLIACSHSSNLFGNILPIGDIGGICKKHGIRLLVDTAQTIGTVKIDVQEMGIDMLAFPGHKGLLGPQGTGGLYISPDLELEPLIHGGTGSQSEMIEQPSVRPDRYESGTQNTPGIAGLIEGVKFVLNETEEKIHNKEWALTQRLMNGLMEVPGIQILGPKLDVNKTAIVSFIYPKMDSSEMAFILDQSFQIAVRAGFHCSPLAHETAGTLQHGAVRASIGYFNTEEHIDSFISAIQQITKHYQ